MRLVWIRTAAARCMSRAYQVLGNSKFNPSDRAVSAKASSRADDSTARRTRKIPQVNIKTPTIREIQIAVGARFGVTLIDLLSDRRDRPTAKARQVAMWLARHATLHSLPEIGRHFGRRDHTTVMHAVGRVNEIMATDAQFGATVRALLASVDCRDSADKRRAAFKVVA